MKVTVIPNNPALVGSFPVNPVAPGVNTEGAHSNWTSPPLPQSQTSDDTTNPVAVPGGNIGLSVAQVVADWMSQSPSSIGAKP